MFDCRANSNPLPLVVTCALAMVTPAACGGNGAGVTTGATMPSATEAMADPRGARDVAGQYSGTIADGRLGGGQVTAEISQYENAAGGIFTFTYGSTALITPWSFLVRGANLTGSGNFSISASSGVCTFSVAAAYRFGHRLDGIYRAVHGCSGESGTFRMKEKCQYLHGSGTPTDVRLKPC